MKQTSNARVLVYSFCGQVSLGFLIIYLAKYVVGFVFASWFIIVSRVSLTLEYMINWSHQNLLLSWLFFRALISFSKRSFKNSFQIKNLCLDQWLLHLENLLKAISCPSSTSYSSASQIPKVPFYSTFSTAFCHPHVFLGNKFADHCASLSWHN